jgi:hypothetical protein
MVKEKYIFKMEAISKDISMKEKLTVKTEY